MLILWVVIVSGIWNPISRLIHPDCDEDGNIICTQEDYDDLKEYWKDEVDSYKDGTNPNWYNIDDETGEAIESDDVTLYMD